MMGFMGIILSINTIIEVSHFKVQYEGL